jgi:hypothetical protein
MIISTSDGRTLYKLTDANMNFQFCELYLTFRFHPIYNAILITYTVLFVSVNYKQKQNIYMGFEVLTTFLSSGS